MINFMKNADDHRFLAERTGVIESLHKIASNNHHLSYTPVPNPYLKIAIEQILSLSKETSLDASNRGGWHSSRDILKYLPIQQLCSVLIETISQYASYLGFITDQLTLAAWANINRDGDYNVAHCHDDALFCGCYYLQIDEDSELPGGSITFYKKAKAGVLATINPQAQGLCLFPSDMFHSVEPSQGNKTRISLAFNIHFGDLEYTWLAVSQKRPEACRLLDPYHLADVKKNFPYYGDSSHNKIMIIPFNKLLNVKP